jgi:hypothetical protein
MLSSIDTFFSRINRRNNNPQLSWTDIDNAETAKLPNVTGSVIRCPTNSAETTSGTDERVTPALCSSRRKRRNRPLRNTLLLEGDHAAFEEIADFPSLGRIAVAEEPHMSR